MSGSPWIPCAEKMPESGHIVIVSATCECCNAGWRCSAYWDAERGWRDFDGDGEGGMGRWKITHWMPMPEPPTKANQ